MIYILIILCCSCISFQVDAATYTTDTNLFENSYTNNLIDMAETQIDNFNNKAYVIFQNSTNYYLVASNKDDITVSNNKITFVNSDIVRVLRVQNGYNYTYEYSSLSEQSTIVNINSIIISNIDTNMSVSSKRYNDYSYNSQMISIGIFVLGLLFAIFLTRERSFL